MMERKNGNEGPFKVFSALGVEDPKTLEMAGSDEEDHVCRNWNWSPRAPESHHLITKVEPPESEAKIAASHFGSLGLAPYQQIETDSTILPPEPDNAMSKFEAVIEQRNKGPDHQRAQQQMLNVERQNDNIKMLGFEGETEDSTAIL
jgi:hypothetical protein